MKKKILTVSLALALIVSNKTDPGSKRVANIA